MGLSCSALSTIASTSSRDRLTWELLLPYFCSTYSREDSCAECAAAAARPLVLGVLLSLLPASLLLLVLLQAPASLMLGT